MVHYVVAHKIWSHLGQAVCKKVPALHNLPEIQPAGASVSNVSSRHGIDGGVVRRCTQKARRVERGEGDDLGDSYWAHVCIDHIWFELCLIH